MGSWISKLEMKKEDELRSRGSCEEHGPFIMPGKEAQYGIWGQRNHGLSYLVKLEIDDFAVMNDEKSLVFVENSGKISYNMTIFGSC